MSSIHYKFRATLEYKTLAFEGLSILASELKREICLKENIKAEAFDLLLQNTHTKRHYAPDEQIPRNSSIIVQRVPKEDGEKLPKIQGVNTGMVQRADTSVDSGINVTGHINQSDFDKLSEEERLSHIKIVSTSKFDPINFQKRPSGALIGPPPPTYNCNRCHQTGHWFKNCPLLNQKRTTGIPSQELMETTADDPQAMLHPSGKYVIPIMHWKARQHKKNVEETPVQEKVPPKELICPLCGHLFKDAIVTTCCGISFCAECISQRLLESEDRHCPGDNCNKSQVSLDSLVPNIMLRQMVSNWQAGTSNEPHERIRIGLAPSNPLLSTSASSSGLSPATTTTQVTTQTSVPILTSAPVVVPQLSVPPPMIPTTFNQPPPNMMVMAPADPLAPPGTSPMVSTLQSGTVPLIPSSLPAVPIMNPMYNRPPISMNNGAQFMDYWDAFLKRNDRPSSRDRDHRRRKRSRERRRSRTPSEDRKRSRRGGRDRDDRKDRDRDRDRDRKRREYDAKEAPRSSYKNGARDSSESRKKRKRSRDDRSPENKKSKELDIKEKVRVDDETAIDDALKEVEELSKLSASEECGTADVGETHMSNSDKVEMETSEKEHSPERKTNEPEYMLQSMKEISPRNRSSESSSSHENSDDHEKSDLEKVEQKLNESENEQDERNKRSDEDREKHKKEKKNKKHKKEKKHKKDRVETEEERKERKRLKKEKKEKRRKDKEEKDRMIDKGHREKKRERRNSNSEGDDEYSKKEKSRDKTYKEDRRKEGYKSRDYKDKDRHRYHNEKDKSRIYDDERKGDSKKRKHEKNDDRNIENAHKNKSSKLEKLAEAKDIVSDKPAVIDEKQIRDHFSPPPSLLQSKKITLNI